MIIAAFIVILICLLVGGHAIARSEKPEELVLCSHGLPWDECPDCSH